MGTLDVASILLVNMTGKLIFQKRDDKPTIQNPGMITAWGGAAEGAETPLEAAVRETREETNLAVVASDFVFFGTYPRSQKIDGKQVVNHVYLLEGIDESKLIIYEGQGYITVDPTDDIDQPLYTDLTKELIQDYRLHKPE